MEVLQDTYKDTKIGRIPKDWEVFKLGELCETITKGTTPTTNGYSYLNEGINFVKVESIDAFGTFKKKMFAHIGEDCYESFKRSQLKEGDILISIAGALGRTAIVTDDILPANTNQAVGILRLKDKSLNTFIRYFLDSYFLQKFIERINVASAQANLNLGHLDKFNIVFPPLPEQQKIAAILSTIDEQISTTDKIIEKSKELKKGLMQKLFSEGIGHTEFKDTKVGRIPKDWQVIQLGELCEVITKGTTPTTNGFPYLKTGINFVKVESINAFGRFIKEKFAFVGEDCYKSFKRSQLKEGDILISIAGALGRTAIVTENILPANTNQAVGILRLKDKSLNNFIRYFLDSYSLQKFIERINVASAQANLNLGHLNKFNIPFPAINEQQKIVAILSEADAKIEKEQKQKAQLEQLKKGLMQQLLTGKKRVNV